MRVEQPAFLMSGHHLSVGRHHVQQGEDGLVNLPVQPGVPLYQVVAQAGDLLGCLVVKILNY